MSTLCTVTNERTTDTHGFVDHFERCEFDGPSHELMHRLESDIATARRCTRPFLGVIQRRGQVRFAVVPAESALVSTMKRSGYHISDVTFLTEDEAFATKLAMAFTRLKRLRGTRINGLSLHPGTGETEYLTFHIDLEAA